MTPLSPVYRHLSGTNISYGKCFPDEWFPRRASVLLFCRQSPVKGENTRVWGPGLFLGRVWLEGGVLFQEKPSLPCKFVLRSAGNLKKPNYL